MTLAEIRSEAARLVGLISPWDDKVLGARVDDWINRANRDVSLELNTPTRYAYINNQTGPLPYPPDAWEDGIISVKVDYDTTPRILPLYTVGEVERRYPGWTAWKNNNSPMLAVYDPANLTGVLDIRPLQTGTHNYSIEYRQVPTIMQNDTDLPLSGQVAAAHRLVAYKAAIYYCEYKGIPDRLKQLEARFTQYKQDHFSDFGADVINPRNPFLRMV